MLCSCCRVFTQCSSLMYECARVLIVPFYGSFHFSCTGRYVAPEAYKDEEYDTKVDVFSFALILQEVKSLYIIILLYVPVFHLWSSSS